MPISTGSWPAGTPETAPPDAVPGNRLPCARPPLVLAAGIGRRRTAARRTVQSGWSSGILRLHVAGDRRTGSEPIGTSAATDPAVRVRGRCRTGPRRPRPLPTAHSRGDRRRAALSRLGTGHVQWGRSTVSRAGRSVDCGRLRRDARPELRAGSSGGRHQSRVLALGRSPPEPHRADRRRTSHTAASRTMTKAQEPRPWHEMVWLKDELRAGESFPADPFEPLMIEIREGQGGLRCSTQLGGMR